MDQDQVQDQGGLRIDGRRPLELRQIRVKLGVFRQADGSAYLEHGNTKILAAVYGPHQVSNFIILLSVLSIDFNILHPDNC